MKKFSPIKIFLSLLAMTFLIHQTVSAFYKPISTESAYFYNANDGFDITGIVIRNETYVETENNGVLHFLVEDGNRISKDGIIANIYDSENASITLSQIFSIQNKISDIEDIMSLNNIQAANLNVANQKVEDTLNNLILFSSFGNFSNITEDSTKLLSALNRRKAVLGETEHFSNQLSSLNAQLQNLTATLTNPKGQITASQSGYFLSKTDGYETAFDVDDLSKITPDFIKNLSQNKVKDNVIGKIVSDYEWYIAANVSLNKSLNFKEGDQLSLRTSVKTSPNLPVTVEKINVSQNGTDAVIIFECSNMNSDLASMRSGPMTVVSKEYSGLRVPKKALRVVDSVRGVYVVSGMQVKFVPVEIIYTADEYILCEKSTDSNALRLYDQVVVKGKNLYDGKIIS